MGSLTANPEPNISGKLANQYTIKEKVVNRRRWVYLRFLSLLLDTFRSL